MAFRLVLVATLAAAPLAAQAQQHPPLKKDVPIPPGSTYRCVDKAGKKYFSSAIPPQCVGQVIDIVSPQGILVKRIDPGEAERVRQAKAAAEANAEAIRAREVANKDIDRRNRALLATYTSEKDVDEARQRALAENRKSASQFEAKINELRTKRQRYEKELALYKDKKDDKSASSSRVVEDNIKSTDLDLNAQQQLLSAKQAEVPGINARFDEEKRRYREAVQASARR